MTNLQITRRSSVWLIVLLLANSTSAADAPKSQKTVAGLGAFFGLSPTSTRETATVPEPADASRTASRLSGLNMISTGPLATDAGKRSVDWASNGVKLVQYQEPSSPQMPRPLPPVDRQNLGRLRPSNLSLRAENVDDDPAPPPPSEFRTTPQDKAILPLHAPRQTTVDRGGLAPVQPVAVNSKNPLSREARTTTDSHDVHANTVRRLPDSLEIQLEPSSRRRLAAPATIGRIDIVDQNVCDVINHSGREVTLIAKGEGTTTLVVWCGTPLSPVSYRIKVRRSVREQPSADDEQLQTWIAQKFSNNDIQLVNHNETLIVSGVARSENEALKIVSAIRDLRLIPVVDQIKVRR